MCQLRLGGDITGLIQEVEDFCKGNDNILKQLLYEGVSTAETGCVSRGDIYDALGGPILVILYRISAISKAVACGKSVGVVKTDNMCYVRVPINLVTVMMGGIKSQLHHIAVVSCCNNVYIAFGDYFLLLRYRRLQWVSNV